MTTHRYTLRADGPLMIERGAYTVVALSIYDGTALASFSSGTWSLVSESGAEVASGSTSTDSGDVTVTIATADTSGGAYSTRWRLRVSMVVTAIPAVYANFERDVWIVRSVLRPVVTVDDLVRRHRDLRDLVDGGDDAIAGYGIEAWASITADLITKGKRTNLIMESWALRKLHTLRWLALLFADAATRFAGEDRYAALATRYGDDAAAEWDKGLRFEYDTNQDGIADTATASTNVLSITSGRGGGPRVTRGWG